MIMTLVSLLVAVALYVWVGVTLGTVFRVLGGAPWKAWFPLVSQVEMLRLVRRPGWHVVLLLVPVYGIVVYYRVLRDLTELFGRPTRLALIGVVLLPVWAGALTGGAEKAVEAGETTAGPVGLDSLFRPASQPGADAYPVAHPPTGSPPSPAGAPPWYGVPGATVGPDTRPVTVYPEPAIPLADAAQPAAAQPAAAQPVLVQPAAAQPAVARPEVAAQPTAAAQPVDIETAVASTAQPGPVMEYPPVVLDSPWSTPAATTGAAVAQAPPPGPVSPPATSSRPVMADPVSVPRPATPSRPSPVAMSDPVSLARPGAPTVVPPSDPSVEMTTRREVGRSRPDPEQALEALDQTVVIDRASSRAWSLVLEDGRRFDLWASSVVLGREPTVTDDRVQTLVIPDDTRTISKMHARLDRVDGVWQVTDLDSTNGIVVTGSDGQEFSVWSGCTSVIGTRLTLGSVAMRLVPRESLVRSL